MLYQVIISRMGCVEYIACVGADSALEAIDRVEDTFAKRTFLASAKEGCYVAVTWSGYEFEARRLEEPRHFLYVEPRHSIELPLACMVEG
jgi:hypothetical protein